MSTLFLIVQHGFSYGLVFTGLIVATMIVAARMNPAIFAGKYPPDVKAKFGPLNARTKRQKKWVALALVAIMAGTLGGMVASMPQAGLTPTLVNVLAAAFVTAFTFNLIDLLVLDWLMFVRWRPSFIVLPGTEGMAGYADYGFHFRGFLKGMVFCVAVAGLTAGSAAGLAAISALLR